MRLCFIFIIFNLTIFQANYLIIYWTDLHHICVIRRTMPVDERSEVSFSLPQGLLPWQVATNFVGPIQAQSTELGSRAIR